VESVAYVGGSLDACSGAGVAIGKAMMVRGPTVWASVAASAPHRITLK